MKHLRLFENWLDDYIQAGTWKWNRRTEIEYLLQELRDDGYYCEISNLIIDSNFSTTSSQNSLDMVLVRQVRPG